ncbi:hypothetical protein EYD10_04828 [Varanus komodoensis]|nr:hypothetical protein EYD10_04828 [Varanus komodoensis]
MIEAGLSCPFSYFHHTTKVLQVDIRQTPPDAAAVNQAIPRLPNEPLGQGSSLFENNVTGLAPKNKLSAQEKQAEVRKLPRSVEKQTRNTLVTANKKAPEKKLEPKQHETQVEDKRMAPAVSLNHTEALDGTPTSNKKEGEKHSAPTSHLEEKKSKGEVSQAKKPAEAKHVASATHQKKAEGMDETRASKLQQLKASHVARPSRAKQASEEPSRGADAAQGRSAQLPTIRDHSASATHRVPTAIPQKRFKAADFKLEPQWAFDDEYLLDNSFQQSVSRYSRLGHTSSKNICVSLCAK